MLKVAVVTDYFPISSHPWAGHSAYQTLRLLAQTCDVQVFYPDITYLSFLRGTKVGPADPAWSPPDIKATYIPFPAMPIVSRPLNGFISGRRLLPHVRRFAPDIILNFSVYPYGLGAVRIARTLGVPAVLVAIGSDLNRMSDIFCAYLTKWTLRHADFVLTVSQHLCLTARRLGATPDRSAALLNGCDTGIFHPRDRTQSRAQLGLDPGAQVIVYVGRLDLRKGLKELVEAVAKLRATRPKMLCYIIGDGPAKAELLADIERHGASATISLMPSCVTQQIALWMGAASLVTLPSYAEGCPNVVIEALSSGRPVVASNVGGIPELMDDSCGRLVPARDAEALAAGLEEVLNQPWDADAISALHSRSWLEVANDLQAVLNEVADRHPSPQLPAR